MELQQLLCLPRNRMLQDVSSSLQVGDNSNCVTFLQSKAAMLKPNKLLINIKLDEICVKPKLHYTADSIVGNDELLTQHTSTLQC